ncbi:MAG: hypothetical protein ACREEK_00915 [Bradyrhizobium sp.]
MKNFVDRFDEANGRQGLRGLDDDRSGDESASTRPSMSPIGGMAEASPVARRESLLQSADSGRQQPVIKRPGVERLSNNGDSRKPYSADTMQKITEMAPLIKRFARERNLPVLAVAGSTAEEYDSRHKAFGSKRFYDEWQDAVIPQFSGIPLPGLSRPDGRVLPAYPGSPGYMQNDLGPANIRMATAAKLFKDSPGAFPPWVRDLPTLAEYVVSDRGNAQVSAMYIDEAKKNIDRLLANTEAPLTSDYMTAMYVDYFRKGPETLMKQIIENRFNSYGAAKMEGFLNGSVPIPTSALPEAAYGARVVRNKRQIYDALGLDPAQE